MIQYVLTVHAVKFGQQIYQHLTCETASAALRPACRGHGALGALRHGAQHVRRAL